MVVWVNQSMAFKRWLLVVTVTVQIKDGDLVYIVTTPSIAKEAVVARVNNAIYKAGGTVKMITQSLRVSGHANARELQLMINLLRPQYLFLFKGSTVTFKHTCRVSLGSRYSFQKIFISLNAVTSCTCLKIKVSFMKELFSW